MTIKKELKDKLVKIFWYRRDMVPAGLFELSQYFRNNGPINFELKNENDEIIAVSKDFRYGTIITSAKSEGELDESIKDAILTTFEVPSSYKQEAGLHKIGSENRIYAFA